MDQIPEPIPDDRKLHMAVKGLNHIRLAAMDFVFNYCPENERDRMYASWNCLKQAHLKIGRLLAILDPKDEHAGSKSRTLGRRKRSNL